ncbi:MAG TPA: AMP-binding protein [Acidimicrobiales bacterium]|nr:AMP-binding protein [Acidimicrobiales bacterium]
MTLDANGLARAEGRTPPGSPRTVAEVLDAGLAAGPTRLALAGRHTRLTYAELDREANRAANALAQLGVGPGDRVAASLPNHPDIVVAFLATMRLGAVWVGVNRVLAPKEKAHLLADSGARVVVAEPAITAELDPFRATMPALAHVVGATPDGSPSLWSDLVAASGTDRPAVHIDPFAPAAIAYTSGTTGWPKGAVHSQHNLVMVGAVLRIARNWRAVPRHAAVLPLATLNVMVIGPLVALQQAGTCVCIDRADPLVIAEWVEREQVQTFSSVPTVIHDLVVRPEVRTDQLRSLSHIGVGGASVPAPIAERFRARFGGEALVGYGLTEAPSIVACQVPGEPHPQGSCGRSLPHVALTVRDEDGRVLGTGESGEVCVGAATDGPLAGVYTPFLGYWGRPDATEAALRDGVLHTGDVGFFGSDGTLFLEGRKNDMIIRGGSNVYAAEVERVLQSEPRVARAAVVGAPDERLGERVVAFVQLAPGMAATPDELRRFSSGELARYKVPDEVRIVDELEVSTTGKVVKGPLRDLVRAATSG